MARFKTAVELLAHYGFEDKMINPYYDKTEKYGKNTHKKIEVGNIEHLFAFNEQKFVFDIECIVCEEVIRDDSFDETICYWVIKLNPFDSDEEYVIRFNGTYDSWSGVGFWRDPQFVESFEKTVTVWRSVE